VGTVTTTEEALERELADARARLERDAGLRPQTHFRRPPERPFLAGERPGTTILFGGLSWRHEQLIRSVFRGSGYNCEILPPPDMAAFQIGKENCHNAQCNPSYFTVGSLLRYLMEKKREGLTPEQINDRYVLYTVGSCGPCRHGMYESEYRFALENAGFAGFRVLLFQQSKDVTKQAQEPGLKYTGDLGFGMLNALTLGDVTSDLLYQIRPYEVNAGETNRVFRECVDQLGEFLRAREPFEIQDRAPGWVTRRLASRKTLRGVLNQLGKFRDHFWGQRYLEALRECRDRIDRIEVDRTRLKPMVKVTGEFFAQSSETVANYDMYAFLESEGAQVQLDPIGSWATYLLFQAKANWRNRKGLGAPHEKPASWQLHKRLANELHFRKRWWLLSFADGMYRRVYRHVGRELGGLAHALVSQDELARLAHPYYNTLARGGEAHLEVAKNIYYSTNRLCHMVLSLKPFGCLPSTLSDGVQSAVTSHFEDMIFVPVETSGDGEVHAHSRVQMALADAKARARDELEKALESTGRSLEQVREYVADHPGLRKPLRPLPRYPGVAGTAANFVLEVGDRMNGRPVRPSH
jgi:predicted nucleotide-binding protein (sugar kinase/HSP70/actin superfamily)